MWSRARFSNFKIFAFLMLLGVIIPFYFFHDNGLNSKAKSQEKIELCLDIKSKFIVERCGQQTLAVMEKRCGQLPDGDIKRSCYLKAEAEHKKIRDIYEDRWPDKSGYLSFILIALFALIFFYDELTWTPKHKYCTCIAYSLIFSGLIYYSI